MSETIIQAETRTEFGKGAARRIRRADRVPAVLYGHGTDPVHVSLPGHSLMLALKNSNALLSIEVGSDKHLALPRQVQRDPIKGFLEHVDLLIVRKGEKVSVEVPLHVTGEPAPGTLVVTEYNEITVEAEATNIPESVELSVEGLEAGTQILASELTLPEGSTLELDPETLVVNITLAPTAEEIDAELAEAEEEAGIERDEATETSGDDAPATAEANAEAGEGESSSDDE
ncbi:50S ribosomal protein L25/general stress protein Ctc [Solicola sp. PLA-1-18]|uniref:50S ribosomal protein L25/general stress protein Ctc n=1 Tax=Solicola sp. PLA-1-18 TaxID=3380532 RepID=UPI003B77F924